LTALLLDRLVQTGGARVLTMSSGGMYTAPLSVDDLEMPADAYKGATQYARAKRAQVTLNELWARRLDSAVHFHAVHPGWADTPGLDASLPRFAQVMGPLLRTAAEGADTLVWLAADDAALQTNGRFWLDRRPRSVHKLPATRRADTEPHRNALWNWVAMTAGLDPASLHPAPSA
jgi:dehydrogenase/reductase SDR family protein 12